MLAISLDDAKEFFNALAVVDEMVLIKSMGSIVHAKFDASESGVKCSGCSADPIWFPLESDTAA
jgi:hypothetical protein